MNSSFAKALVVIYNTENNLVMALFVCRVEFVSFL